MLQSGLAEMYLRIDHTGQDMKAPGLENLVGGLAGKRAQGCDAAIPYA